MRITHCEKKDIPRLAEIEKQCFSAAWDDASLSSAFSLPHFCALAALDGEELFGYICGTVLFEDGEIFRVAVLPNKRKSGVGAALTAAFCEEAAKRGAEQVFLEVRVQNAPALALYQKCGFETNRLRKNYYENGDDGLEMIKKL